MNDSIEKNGVPVLERTMEILGLLERRPEGKNIRDLTKDLGVPRSTVYRILNTLQAHRVVRRNLDGTYVLGPRLLALASHVSPEATYDVMAIAQPVMARLAEETGEGNKLSVLDRDSALVVAATPGTQEYGLHPAVGQSFPLHAGAASKVIMAHLAKEELDRLLAQPLKKYTQHTLTDPAKLRAELTRIRNQGWAQDRGEHVGSVCALAAPIYDPSGKFLAALSVPFLAGKDGTQRELLRHAVVAAAQEISGRIGGA